MTSILTREERARLTSTLAGWGMTAAEIDETLADGVFGPGAIGMSSDHADLGLAVGILVDEPRDPQLAELFNHRRSTDDEQFLTDWEPAETRVWTFLCPHAPEALLAYSIGLTRPLPLRRTYLLLASKHANVLASLTQAGTSVWLVPQTVGMREWAREGTGTAHDIWGQSLPLGPIPAGIANVQLALTHVRYND